MDSAHDGSQSERQRRYIRPAARQRCGREHDKYLPTPLPSYFHACTSSVLTKSPDNAGQTALHFATSKNSLSTARKLIAGGATTRKKDKRQQLPLHRAAAIGSVPMLKLLLDNKSRLDATDVDGMTALHHSISEGHGDAALFLLKAGIDFTKEDRDGNMALKLVPDEKVRLLLAPGLVDFALLTC
jgi:ankyrin repeat protein